MEEKKINIVTAFLLFSIVILFFFFIYVNNKIPDVLTDEEDWEEDWICSKEEFYSQEDANKGWGCLLEECTSNFINGYPVKNCKCVNETVTKICTEKLYFKKMEWKTFRSPFNTTIEEGTI